MLDIYIINDKSILYVNTFTSKYRILYYIVEDY